jgi:hypothetical protein
MRTQTYTQPRLGSLPLTVRQPVIVACGVKGCPFEASALTEARALRGWAAHRVLKHQQGGHRGQGTTAHN